MPARGIRLSKCVTDIRVLLNLFRDLLEHHSNRIDLQSHYSNKQMQQVDNGALRRWKLANEQATNRSPITKIKQRKRKASASGIGGLVAQMCKAFGSKSECGSRHLKTFEFWYLLRANMQPAQTHRTLRGISADALLHNRYFSPRGILRKR